MIATLVSLALAALLFIFHAEINEADIAPTLLWFFLISSFTLLIVPLIHAFTWIPLQKGEQNTTPHLMDMFSKDRRINLKTTLLLIFPLISIALVVLNTFGHGFDKHYLILIWIVLFGFAIDMLIRLISRVIDNRSTRESFQN